MFSSPQADQSDGDGLQGAIYFKTDGTTIDPSFDDKLMDINGTTRNTVTIRGDLDVNGAISMNGAAFTAPITSDARGIQTIGTQGAGEWKALHLWDDGGTARITFGSGTDAVPVAGDIELVHDPATASLTLSGTGANDPHRLQFRDNATYIHSSADNILDLVAPTLNIDSETAFTNATSTTSTTTGALKVTGGISTQENLYVGGTATVNGVFTVGAGGDEFSITESSDDVTIDNSQADKDIIFTVNDGTVADTEVLRLVGAESSLKMTSTNPLQFNAAANSITGTDATTLTVTSPTIKLDASGAGTGTVDITVGETTVKNELELLDQLVFSDAGTDEFLLAEDGSEDYVFKALTRDKDIVFNANMGGADTEVARVDGSAGSLVMTDEQQLQFDIATNYINSTSVSYTHLTLPTNREV